MANNNVLIQDEKLEVSVGKESTPVKGAKTLLSKSSRAFVMPKSNSPKGKSDDLSSKGNTSVKLLQKRTMESDFSTESSDNETDTPRIKLGSPTFYLGSSSRKLDLDGDSTSKTENRDSFLEICDKTPNYRDVQPKSSNAKKPKFNKKNKKNQRVINGQEATIMKPRKRFKNKQEKQKFVESYRAKKKTEICKNWELSGSCKFGDSCAFAHGLSELVVKNHLPQKYKTKMCKQFHEEGYCPYGSRCQFIHLIIQKEVSKFNHSEILKEGIYQYESRSKSMNFSRLEDLMVNAFKSNRLPIFAELTSTEEMKKSDEELSEEWNSSKDLVGVQA